MAAKYFKMNGLAIFLFFFGFLSKADDSTEYSAKHREIALRNIGHQLLLKTNDSTSTVLPIKQIRENLYQIEFQSQFSFVDDTLISLVQRQFQASKLPNEYIVLVLNCNNQKIVFGYEISSKMGNTIACSGRSQPKGCYLVQIEFQQKNTSNQYSYFLLLIPFAFISYFIKKKYFEPKKSILLTDNQPLANLGNSYFNSDLAFVQIKSQKIELTEKENKLLKMLLENHYQTIDREFLMMELWEAEGTIVVGRSLDVLVSKLRKKLEADPAIKINNVHGKGYKLVG